MIERFEDLECWKQARKIVNQIYKFTEQKPFANDWALKEQIRRAAISIMSNIAEGSCRRSNKEFLNFLNISLGSLEEVKSQLYIALDQELSPKRT